MNTKNNNVWIGLVQVKESPNHNLLDGAKGAFVNVLAIADNSSDFINKVKMSVENLELIFVQIEDVELFNQRVKNHRVGKKIINLAKEVDITKELRFSDFHVYLD